MSHVLIVGQDIFAHLHACCRFCCRIIFAFLHVYVTIKETPTAWACSSTEEKKYLYPNDEDDDDAAIYFNMKEGARAPEKARAARFEPTQGL